MGRRILAIAAATVIALIGAVLVLIYARGADARAVEAASPQTVYVSSATVPAGTSLKEAVRLELITQTKTAAAAVPAGALTSVNDSNSALLALKDIPPGQYILEASFGETPVGEKAIQVPAGRLAVSVQLSDPARVGNFVTPGSFLTIFATHPEATAPAASGGDEDGDATGGAGDDQGDVRAARQPSGGESARITHRSTRSSPSMRTPRDGQQSRLMRHACAEMISAHCTACRSP